jgi:hypothetical protein
MAARRSSRKSRTGDEAGAAVREALRAHGPEAIAELARLAREASSENVRLAAIRDLIEMAYGKLKDHSDGDDAAHGITVRFVAPHAEKS